MIKSLQGTFNLLWSGLNLLLCDSFKFTSANETIGEKIGNYCPVFARSAQSAKNPTKNFMAHRPEETICCLQAWSIHCSLSYSLWLEAGGEFSLDNFNILCLFHKILDFVQVSGVFCVFHSLQDLYDSKQCHFCHKWHYNQHKMKVPQSDFYPMKCNMWYQSWQVSGSETSEL